MSVTEWFVKPRWQYPVTFPVAFKTAKREPGAATKVINEVAEKWGLKASDLTSKSRVRYLAWARFEAAYRLRTECPWLSLPTIGRRLGGRDHTSILNAVRRYQELTVSGEIELVREAGRYPVKSPKMRGADVQQGGGAKASPAQASGWKRG